MMVAARMRAASFVCSVLALAACGNDSTGPEPIVPAAIIIVSGNGRVGEAGQSFPIAVKVTGTTGRAVGGATVSFAVTNGTARVSPVTAVTDTAGVARSQVTLGTSAGNVSIAATVKETDLIVTFVATIGTPAFPIACRDNSPQTPAVGGVLPGIAGSGICLGGGSTGAEYALVAFHANTDSTAFASFSVVGRGVSPIATPSIGPTIASSATVDALSPLGKYHPSDVQGTFDVRLRESARRELTSMIPAARAWHRQRASFATIPANPALGSLVTLNAQGDVPCDNPISVVGRIAAVSSSAIVVADTANPTGGFTDAEYAGFASLLDTLVGPLDIQAFGQPSDIDKNGKTIILFTKEVNRLTPRGSGGIIGGFFYERDLFPKTSSNGLGGCETSNVAEMYYALVPDPTGRFSDVRRKTDVSDLTPSTLAHEFQHLINAGRRLYVNDAETFETVWLNEGLSHIAEELLYYHVARLAPRQNIAGSTITASTAGVNAFNNLQGDNIGRYELFIGKPPQTSVYAGNDSLETRGATWNLLRYLADHRGSSDGDVWSQLVNTGLSGHNNLARVFGSNYMTQVRDWATSVFSDDVPGVTDARFLEQSWNMRDIFPRLVGSNNQPLNRFPLTVVPLPDGSANLSVVAGGAAYIRFFVSAGSQASIDWSSSGLSVTPLMQFTVVRSR